MRAPAHESLGLQLRDDDRRVGLVDPERRGQLAHRHRPACERADRARAAEAHAERLGHLAPPGVVENQVGHQQPDLARAHAASASGLSCAAVRRAEGAADLARSRQLPSVTAGLSGSRQIIDLAAYGFPPPPGGSPLVGPFNVLDARGAIFCETKDGKISEMRMYWNRYAGGKEEPKA